MMCTNLRITAPMTTFLAFPRAASRSAYALQPGHRCIAVIAGQYNAALSPTLPIFDIRGRRRTDVPDSKWLGVTPTSAAAALADSYCSMSPNSASSLAAVIIPMPTIEVSNCRLVRSSLCAARCSLIALDCRQLFGHYLHHRLKRGSHDRVSGIAQAVLLLELGLEQIVTMAHQRAQVTVLLAERLPGSWA